jgi:hypothetical protein
MFLQIHKVIDMQHVDRLYIINILRPPYRWGDYLYYSSYFYLEFIDRNDPPANVVCTGCDF